MAATLVRSVKLKLTADDGDTEAKLDSIAAKAEELARLHPELKVKIDSAAASAKLAVLRKELKNTDAEADRSRMSLSGLGNALNDMTLGLPRGVGEMTMFQKVVAGIGVATGIGEPAVAALSVGVMGLASGVTAAGLGLGIFGAVAKSAYSQVSTAVQSYGTAMSTTGKASVTAMASYKAQLAALTPDQRNFAVAITSVQQAWQGFVASNTAGVTSILNQGMGLVPAIFARLQPFLAPTEKALSGIIGQLGKGLDSAGFKSWIDAFAKASGPNLTNLAGAIGHIAVGLGGILKAFLPMSTTMTGGLDKLTAKFATWGTTLGSHSGFQSLITMAKQDGPLLGQILKNVGTAIKNVGSDMAGLSTFSNSRMLLQLAGPLSSLLKAISGHPDLVNLGLWGMTAYAGLGKAKIGLDAVKGGIGALKGGASAFQDLNAGFGNSAAAASAATGAWGTIGGKLSTAVTAVKGWGIWSKIASGATKIWTGVQLAFNAVMDMNPLVLIVIAIAALVAAIVLLTMHSKAFRDFWKAVWHDIASVFDTVRHAIAAGFDFITHAASAAFNWVKSHWPLILAILTGPIGLAVLFISKHWDTIKKDAEKFVSTVLADIRRFADDVLKFFKNMFNSVVSTASRWYGDMVKWVRRTFDDFVAREKTGLDNIVHWFKGLPGRIVSALGNLGSLLYNAGKNVIQGLINGVKSMVGAVGHAVSSVVGEIKNFLPFSPAKKGPLSGAGSPDVSGRKIGLMLAQGMEGSTSAVTASAARVARAAGIGGAVHGGAASGGTARLQLEWVGGSADQALITLLKQHIRIRGGNPSVLGA